MRKFYARFDNSCNWRALNEFAEPCSDGLLGWEDKTRVTAASNPTHWPRRSRSRRNCSGLSFVGKTCENIYIVTRYICDQVI